MAASQDTPHFSTPVPNEPGIGGNFAKGPLTLTRHLFLASSALRELGYEVHDWTWLTDYSTGDTWAIEDMIRTVSGNFSYYPTYDEPYRHIYFDGEDPRLIFAREAIRIQGYMITNDWIWMGDVETQETWCIANHMKKWESALRHRPEDVQGSSTRAQEPPLPDPRLDVDISAFLRIYAMAECMIEDNANSAHYFEGEEEMPKILSEMNDLLLLVKIAMYRINDVDPECWTVRSQSWHRKFMGRTQSLTELLLDIKTLTDVLSNKNLIPNEVVYLQFQANMYLYIGELEELLLQLDDSINGLEKRWDHIQYNSSSSSSNSPSEEAPIPAHLTPRRRPRRRKAAMVEFLSQFGQPLNNFELMATTKSRLFERHETT